MRIGPWSSCALSVSVFVVLVMIPVFVSMEQETWTLIIICGFALGLANIIINNLDNRNILPALFGVYVCILVFVLSTINGYSEKRIIDGAIVGAVAGGVVGLLIKTIAKTILLPRKGKI